MTKKGGAVCRLSPCFEIVIAYHVTFFDPISMHSFFSPIKDNFMVYNVEQKGHIYIFQDWN